MADISPSSDAKGSIREIILPKGLDLDRPKRTRTSFTAEQLYRLEMEFQRCQYVVGRERTELARQLNLSETQVPGGQAVHSSAQACLPISVTGSSRVPSLALDRDAQGRRIGWGERPQDSFPSINHSFPSTPSRLPGPTLCPPWPSPGGRNCCPLEFFLDHSLENNLLASSAPQGTNVCPCLGHAILARFPGTTLFGDPRLIQHPGLFCKHGAGAKGTWVLRVTTRLQRHSCLRFACAGRPPCPLSLDPFPALGTHWAPRRPCLL